MARLWKNYVLFSIFDTHRQLGVGMPKEILKSVILGNEDAVNTLTGNDLNIKVWKSDFAREAGNEYNIC